MKAKKFTPRKIKATKANSCPIKPYKKSFKNLW